MNMPLLSTTTVPIERCVPEPAQRAWTVVRYCAEHRDAWDRFVRGAKSTTFLFERGYLEYHADRFVDHSLMVFQGAELIAVLPAHRVSFDTVSSHDGLTYGGLVVKLDATLRNVLDLLRTLLQRLNEDGVRILRYKRIPRFYSRLPDDEIDYALFRLGARLYRRDCAIVVSMADRLPLRRDKRNKVQGARRAGLTVGEDVDFSRYWQQLLEPRLAERYGAKPVHSVSEIQQLAERFPANIRLFTCQHAGQLQAGVVIYETPTVAHQQYSALALQPVHPGALDLLTQWLIDERYRDKRFFDFGTCNENGGLVLNEALLRSKEAFSGRTSAHDYYELDTDAAAALG